MCTCVFFNRCSTFEWVHRIPVRKTLSYIQRTIELLKTKKQTAKSTVKQHPHHMTCLFLLLSIYARPHEGPEAREFQRNPFL